MKLNRAIYHADAAAFARDVLGFQPDPTQTAVLNSATARGILCCSRQWGKSTTTAAKAVHHSWHSPESLVLIAAPTQRQSAELLRKCRRFLRRLGERRKSDGTNTESIVLGNGSRIVALPGDEDNVRGFSAATLVLIDEASRVDDELYHALLPMLATTNGQLWQMSTPNGRQGFFYQCWTSPSAGYTRFQVTAAECSRISSTFLEAERLRMPTSAFQQEYMCVFHEIEDALLLEAEIDAAFRPEED